MKFNPTLAALGVLLGAGVIVGAFQLGQQGGDDESSVSQQAGVAAVEPAGQPPQSQRDVALFPDAEGPRFSHFRVGNRNVKSIFADGKYVWVGTSGGVIRYDTEQDDYQLFNNKNAGLLSNGIFHISRLDHRLAIGTYGGGLALFDPEADSWQIINIPQGLADQFVYDVLKLANGDVWIATWSGANLVRGGEFDNPDAWETFTVENTNGGLPNPWVYGVEEGANGDMWFATEAGLALYRDGVWTNWQHEDGLGADYEIVKNAIQFRSDPGQASMHHSRQKEEQGLQNVNVAYNPNYVISMQVQNDGTVWAGTWGAGLSRFKDGEWKNFTSFDGLPANHIFMLYLDPEENLWVGTSKGLARLDQASETFSVKTMNDGLYAENVFSMAKGQANDLWIGSFGGVAHIEHGWQQ